MSSITGTVLGDLIQINTSTPIDSLIGTPETTATINLAASPVITLGFGGSVPNGSTNDPLLNIGASSQPLLGDISGNIVDGILGAGGLDGKGNVLSGLGGILGGGTVAGSGNVDTGGLIAGLNDVVSTADGTAKTVGDIIAQTGTALDSTNGDSTPPGTGPGAGPNPPSNPAPGTASAGVQIFHTPNGDVMIGTSSNDTMIGNVGNDHFYGLGGNDSIDGGFGYDTAFLQGGRAEYTAAFNNGTLTLTDTASGRDGTDTLKNVERLAFNDSTVAFDINGDAGQTYRLYQAAFDRTPDQPGASFWTARLDHGETLQQVSQEFLNSAEFQQKYSSNLSNHDFTNALYLNVLGRSADDSGLAYWDTAMANGSSRAQVLASFSESAENHANVDPHLANGILLDYGVYV